MLRVIVAAVILQHVRGLVMDTPSTPTDALVVMLANKVTTLENRLSTLESSQNECGCDGQTNGNPAFMATLSAELNHCTKGQAVIFQDIQLNVGNAYSNTHGIFTAPISGTYVFASTLTAEPGHVFHTALVRNNVANILAYLYADNTDIWLERSTTAVTHLDAGDDVWLSCIGGSVSVINAKPAGENHFNSHMSGFLLSAD